jgi:[NiFe] hydrogenase diaphorase moiety small subunit
MPKFEIDGQPIEFIEGQTIMQAAARAGIYIPHLCYHPDFAVHGSCRVCGVKVNGRTLPACNTRVVEGMRVNNSSDSIQLHRRQVLEMLFVEGNHVCPSCEKSGSCMLQSVAEYCGMLAPRFQFQYPNRKVDASHPDYLLDHNRCILCELCVRASRDVDGKSLFSIAGRGHKAHLQVNADGGLLGNSDFSASDRAATICPVGVFLPRGKGFDQPIGRRVYDTEEIQHQQVKHD